MNPDSFVSPELIELFNKAASLARNGEYSESVKTFDEVINAKNPDGKPYIVSGRFSGITHLRKSWALMDLEKYSEAKEMLENKNMKIFLGQFEPKDLYDYYFSYANILGNLGEVEKMKESFNKAIEIAEDMNNKELFDQATKLMAAQVIKYHLQK